MEYYADRGDPDCVRAYVEGRNAYHDDRTYSTNPYPPGSLEAANWGVGWEDAFAEESEAFGRE